METDVDEWKQVCRRQNFQAYGGRGPKRSLCDPVKAKPRPHWQSQNFEQDRPMGFLTRRAAYRKQDPPKRAKYLGGREAGWAGPPKPFETGHEDSGFGICPGLDWVQCFLIPTFWNGSIYILCYSELEVCNLLFDFKRS